MADVTGTFYAGGAFVGYGAELRIGQADTSPETFSAISNVTVIAPGDMSTGIVDITHLRSLDRHREKKLTIRDSGPWTITGSYTPGHGAHTVAGGDGFSATHNLPALWRDCREANVEIELPVDAGSPAIVLEMRGGVTKYQIGQITIDQKVEFTAEITPLRGYALP